MLVKGMTVESVNLDPHLCLPSQFQSSQLSLAAEAECVVRGMQMALVYPSTEHADYEVISLLISIRCVDEGTQEDVEAFYPLGRSLG
jgi:hypothetical protein